MKGVTAVMIREDETLKNGQFKYKLPEFAIEIKISKE